MSEMTLTELLENKVNWSRMGLNHSGCIRMDSKGSCPLVAATDSMVYGTFKLTGISPMKLIAYFWTAADRTQEAYDPIAARWRHWMLEQIHSASSESAK